LVAGRLTVPNIESRCNQLKLGHPLAVSLWMSMVSESISSPSNGVEQATFFN
jgi:hypothetical protein